MRLPKQSFDPLPGSMVSKETEEAASARQGRIRLHRIGNRVQNGIAQRQVATQSKAGFNPGSVVTENHRLSRSGTVA